jgi:2-aminoadipate transaminase
MDAFRLTAREVIEHPDAATILQLGSPSGYEPLRRWLLSGYGQAATDDVLVTSGCQQALDLLARVLVQPGDTVAIEDPVYPGLQAVFVAAGARVVGVPTNAASGISLEALEATLLRDRPKLLVVTPDFQNPTGGAIPLDDRKRILALAREHGVIVIENAIYNSLRYTGVPLPGLKALDETGDVIYIDSFSKLAFPGLRVGWIIANESLIARLTHAKQWCDLHSDQLSQAILYRFALTGRLDTHIAGVCRHGSTRLRAAIDACRDLLPEGTRFTEPEGGMSLWVSLPEPLDAGELLPKAERAGVTYLPGRYFAVNRADPGGFRLCFAGLSPERIREGVTILGEVFGAEQARLRAARRLEPLPALV